jgi:hypothetical protein
MLNKLKYSVIIFIIILIVTYYLKPSIFQNEKMSITSSYIIIAAIISFYITVLVDNYISK